MYTKWTQDISDPADKEKFKQRILNARGVLDRLREILEDMERDLERAEINPKNYDVPNWSYRQAHANGFRQCIGLIKDLINLDQEGHK